MVASSGKDAVGKGRLGGAAAAAAIAVALLVVSAAPAGAAAPPPVGLTLRFDPGDLDLGQDVAVDSQGNVILTGTAQTGDDKDFITAKFAPDGTRLWLQRINQGKDDRGETVAVDAAGNVYAAGAVSSLVGDNVILVKYLPDGTESWKVTFDKGTSEAARGLALDSAGNLYVTGVSLSRNGGDGFLVKFNRDGVEQWSKPINLWWHEEAFDVAVDAEGNAVVVGRVFTDKAFDVIVRKFNPQGAVLWTQFIATPLQEEARGVHIAPDGGILVAGTTTVPAPAGGNATTDYLLAKWSRDGRLLWSKAYDVAGGNDEGRAVLADPWGGLYLTGFGPVGDSKQAVTLRLDGEGRELWRHEWGGPGIDGAGALALTSDGSRLLVAGATQREGLEFDYLLLAYDENVPKAAFTAVPSSGGRVAFEDASTPGRDALAAWRWDFGDGTTSLEQNPVHTYAYGGKYTVTLTVTDGLLNGATRTMTLDVPGPARPTTPVVTPPGTGGLPGTGDLSPDANAQPKPGAEQGSGSGGGIPAFEALAALAAIALTGLLLGQRAGGRKE
ncbi:MAG TPA: PKD domain-containing protein [Candidatus Thermoplasmatota archaeon]|nr:PKD domain-containing protein [Candidatus Thermoplasmatota archaeon]